MIRLKDVEDYLHASSNGSEEDSALVASLLRIAKTIAGRQPGGNTDTAEDWPRGALAVKDADGDERAENEGERPEMQTLAEGISLFVQRYPMDSRAYEYLVKSSPSVVAHVLRDFRPQREGEADYSSLITTYVKRIRSAHAHGAPHRTAAAAALPPPVLLAPGRNRAGSQDRGPRGRRSSRHPSPEAPAERAPRPDLEEELQAFVRKYPVDDRAYGFLTSAETATQWKVVREFRPRTQGEDDYSALLTSFTKRCQAPSQSSPPAPSQPVQQHAASRGGGQSGGSAALKGAKHGISQSELDAFFAQYPVDERACDFFQNSALEVQEKVLKEFRPPYEGEASYSGLLTAFVKRCRTRLPSNGSTAEVAPAADYQEEAYAPWSRRGHADRRRAHSPQRAAAATAAAGGGGGHDAEQLEDLESFRARFPMDKRAFEFLTTAPQEVQERVMDTFVPKRADDSDFSAPVTAYVKSLRNQAAAEGGLPSYASDKAMARFFKRYPCDERAEDFLRSASPEVRAQVLREFRPRTEGEADYSGAITSFVKRCRAQSSESTWGQGAPQRHSGGWRAPPARPSSDGWSASKRPRLA